MIKNRYFALLIVIFTKFCLAIGNVWAKDVFTAMKPTTFMGLTLLIAIISVSIYTFVIKKERIPYEHLNPRIWSYLIQIGISLLVLGSPLATFALNYMGSTTNAFLQNMVSLVTIIFSVVMLGEKPNRWQLIGAAVVLTGVYVFFPSKPQGSEILGIIMVLIGIVSLAYYNNLSRKLALLAQDKISNNFITTMSLIIGGGIAVIIYLSMSGWDLHVPSLKAWGSILFTGLVVRSLGSILWNLVLRTIRSYEASLAGTSYVIWGTLLSIWVLGETVVARQWLGIVLLIIGLILVQIRPASDSEPPAAAKTDSFKTPKQTTLSNHS